MANITIKVSLDTLEKMREFYQNDIVPNNGEYIDFFARVDNGVVTAYKSKNDEAKVVFSSLDEARIWDNNAMEKEPKKTSAPKKASWLYLDEQIGSDEVGVGDFFGPICVCAAYVNKSDIEFLKSLGVDDSKRLTDEKILELGHILINRIEYAQCSIDNIKYNEVNESGLNMNAIKAKLHNQVLSKLAIKHPGVRIFVDQFVDQSNYYHYLEGSNNIVYGITFRTKGESYYPSVAAGSIIARYSFLKKMEALNQKYNVSIPFGASVKVNEFAKEFVNKFGQEELDKIVKKNFKNYKEIFQ